VYNNYWYNNTGHAFDMGKGTNALLEGNVFNGVNTPSEGSSRGATFAVESSDQSTCNSAMGRTCVANSLVNAGKLSVADVLVLSSWPEGEGNITVMDASEVASYVVAHAGVGKLGVSPTSPSLNVTPSPSSSAIPSSPVLVKRDGIRDATPSGFDQPREPTWFWKTVTRPTAVPTGAPSRVPAQQEHGVLPSLD
jgi:hypothetical protein